jgi:hypothetical protein
MNHWQNEHLNEYLVEYHHRDLLAEAKQARLANKIIRSNVYHPSLFERTMFNFANWMISTGKGLRKRYEIPSVNCSQHPTNSFAQ